MILKKTLLLSISFFCYQAYSKQIQPHRIVKFPSKIEMGRRLTRGGMSDFVKKVGVVDFFADKEIAPVRFVIEINRLTKIYFDSLNQQEQSLDKNKPALIKESFVQCFNDEIYGKK